MLKSIGAVYEENKYTQRLLTVSSAPEEEEALIV
jgi:hypothetical protein